jgi:hypothetical protein
MKYIENSSAYGHSTRSRGRPPPNWPTEAEARIAAIDDHRARLGIDRLADDLPGSREVAAAPVPSAPIFDATGDGLRGQGVDDAVLLDRHVAVQRRYGDGEILHVESRGGAREYSVARACGPEGSGVSV